MAKWDFGGGGPWALRCLTRESVLWLLPGLVLLSQAILALVPHGKLEGVALVLVLAMVGLELSLLVTDAAVASSRPDRRSLHDLLAGTVVVLRGDVGALDASERGPDSLRTGS